MEIFLSLIDFLGQWAAMPEFGFLFKINSSK